MSLLSDRSCHVITLLDWLMTEAMPMLYSIHMYSTFLPFFLCWRGNRESLITTTLFHCGNIVKLWSVLLIIAMMWCTVRWTAQHHTKFLPSSSTVLHVLGGLLTPKQKHVIESEVRSMIHDQLVSLNRMVSCTDTIESLPRMRRSWMMKMRCMICLHLDTSELQVTTGLDSTGSQLHTQDDVAAHTFIHLKPASSTQLNL